MTAFSCHVTCAFQSESTLYSDLNIKKIFAQKRCNIWSLSDCNGTRTHKHLVRKRTLKHLVRLAKWVLICTVHLTLSSYKLSGCGFESHCSHLNFRCLACFEQGVSWHSDHYRVWIHSETRTWHDKNRGGFRGGDLVTCHPLFSDMTLQSQILVTEPLFLTLVSKFIRKYLLSQQFSYMYSSCSNPAISLAKFSGNFFQEKLSISESPITGTRFPCIVVR